MSPRRVAAIDIGTNSVLLLLAEQRDGEIVAISDSATITRLGQGVDKAGALAPEAIERTLACLRGYAKAMEEASISTLAAVGTSAMRDAGGEAFVDRASEILGTRPRVISGAREAELTFHGALIGLSAPDERTAVVFDIGGGSTEIIVGSAGDGAISAAKSLDIGAVRLTERHVRADPPTAEMRDAIRQAVRTALQSAPDLSPKDLSSPIRLVGVAGTVTTLSAMHQRLDPYVGSEVHGATLSRGELSALVTAMAAVDVETRKSMPGLPEKRADVIIAGALIADEVMRHAQCDTITVSDRGVRWGLARELLAG